MKAGHRYTFGREIRRQSLRAVAETLVGAWTRGDRGAVLVHLRNAGSVNAATVAAVMCAAFASERPGELETFARFLVDLEDFA